MLILVKHPLSKKLSSTIETVTCMEDVNLSDSLSSSVFTIWSLHEEVIIILLQHLHIKDLLNLAAVSLMFNAVFKVIVYPSNFIFIYMIIQCH